MNKYDTVWKGMHMSEKVWKSENLDTSEKYENERVLKTVWNNLKRLNKPATIEQKVLEIEHIYKTEKSEHIWNKSQTSDNKVKQKSNTSEKVCTTLNMSEQKSEKYWNVWNNLESLYF